MNLCKLLRPTFRVAVVSVLGVTTLTTPLLAQAKPVCTPYPRVDLGTASVAGVPLDTTLGFVRAAVGSRNIRAYTVQSEEGTERAYTLRICGHKVEWYSDGVAWRDSTFRTEGGLRVGWTLSDFDSVLGPGKLSGDHGLQVRYEHGRYNLYVEVGDCYSYTGAEMTVDRSCRVNLMALEEGYRPAK